MGGDYSGTFPEIIITYSTVEGIGKLCYTEKYGKVFLGNRENP